MISVIVAGATARADETGQLVAVVVAGLVGWAGIEIHRRWAASRGIDLTAADSKKGVKPQAKVVSDTDDTSRDTTPDGSAGVTTEPTLDEWLKANDGNHRTTKLVAAAMRKYGVSKATVMRTLRGIRRGGS